MNFLKRLFTKKDKNNKKEKTSRTGKQKLNKSEKKDIWIIESIIQFTRSRQWRRDLKQFTEANCFSFMDVEENSHDHFRIYNEFIALVESKLEQFMTEIGLTEEEFYRGVELAYRTQTYSNFVEQLLSLEDFELFKRMMIKTNKKLEYEQQKYYGEKVDNYESEKAELEYAIELSNKMQMEYQKRLESEEQELHKAINESKLEFQRQKTKEKELADKQKQIEADKKKKEQLAKEAQKQKEAEEKAEREKEEARLNKIKQDMADRMLQEKQNLEKRMKDLEILKKNKVILDGEKKTTAKSKPTKKENTESLEARRKRLQKQRDMFLKIKKEQEEKENGWNDSSTVSYKNDSKGIDQKKIDERKDIYKKVLKN